MNLFNDQFGNNLKWFIGVVEDANDPEQAGRVKVRCFGVHTPDKTILPTGDLPWASIMSPTSSANMRGINSPVHSLMPGSNVIGFFMDGNAAQYPFVLGSLPGLMPDVIGSSETTYATLSRTNNFIPGENDYGVLATDNIIDDEIDHPMISDMDGTRTTKVTCARPAQLGDTDPDFYPESFYESPTWDEPYGRGSNNRGSYPFTKTVESVAGHVVETDDDPNFPRLLWYHKDGTYEEFTPNGRKLRVKGNNYEITLGNNNIYIDGNCNLTVNGDMRHFVQGNYYLEVLKDYHVRVGGSMKRAIETGNDLKTVFRGYESKFIQSDQLATINGSVKNTIGSTIEEIIGDSYDITIGGFIPGHFNVTASSVFPASTGATITFNSGTIDINGGISAAIKGGTTTIIGDFTGIGVGSVLIQSKSLVDIQSLALTNIASPAIVLSGATLTAVAPSGITLN